MGDRQLRGRRNEALHTPLVLSANRVTWTQGGGVPSQHACAQPQPNNAYAQPIACVVGNNVGSATGGGGNKALLTSLVLLGIHTTPIHFQELTKHGLRAANTPTPSLNTTTPDPSLMSTPIALTPTLRVFPQPT